MAKWGVYIVALLVVILSVGFLLYDSVTSCSSNKHKEEPEQKIEEQFNNR